MAKTRRVVVQPKKKSKEPQLTRLGAALRQLGSWGGGALGGLAGMPGVGADLGHSMGAAVSKWLGSGDYTVRSNSILRASNGIPMMHKEDQSVVVRHREYIGPISGSTGFTVSKALTLNPGNSATFPWLSRQASLYQEYEFKGLVFHYIPTSGTAVSSTSAALGSVMMQTSYRSNDSAPTSKQELLNEYWASESVPFNTFVHPIECDPKENRFGNVHYVRNGPVPAGDTPLLYDHGVTFIATSGQQSFDIVGDLWVTYEVVLKKPIVNSNVTSPFQAGIYQLQGVSNVSPLAIPLPDQVLLYRSIGDIGFTRLSNTQLRFDPGLIGRFFFRYLLRSNGSSFNTCNMTAAMTLTNATFVDPGIGGNSETINAGGLSNSLIYHSIYFDVTDSSSSVTITLPTTWTFSQAAAAPMLAYMEIFPVPT